MIYSTVLQHWITPKTHWVLHHTHGWASNITCPEVSTMRHGIASTLTWHMIFFVIYPSVYALNGFMTGTASVFFHLTGYFPPWITKASAMQAMHLLSVHPQITTQSLWVWIGSQRRDWKLAGSRYAISISVKISATTERTALIWHSGRLVARRINFCFPWMLRFRSDLSQKD